MDFANYEQEDFLMDESFIQWVNNPTEESEQCWREWLARHPEKQDTVDQARALLLSLRFQAQPLSEEKMDTIQSSIHRRIHTKQQPVVRRLMWPRQLAVAASLTALLLLTALIAYYLQTPARQVYRTASAETKEIQLPDQSLVTLNANSQIYYAENEQTGDREVWLEGEAYFHVNRQTVGQGQEAPASRRFVVHTPQMDVVVLGTRFNVNNRRGETKVVLHSGKVMLQLPAENLPENEREVIMQPGEMVSMARNQKLITRKEVDPQDYTAWKENLLVLDEMPLREIRHLLEDNFGYKVVLKNKELEQMTFSGTFPANDPEVLIHTISKSVTIETVGNTLIVK